MARFPFSIIDFRIFLFLYLRIVFIFILFYLFIYFFRFDMYWIYSNLARPPLNESCTHPCNVDK